MGTKVKGLLKGLKHISHMFEEKEDEIQIGFPTDVKHVAHIGYDGPSATSTPSWMNEFQSSPDVLSAGQLSVQELSSQDMHQNGVGAQNHHNDIPKSRRHCSGDAETSPTKKSSDSKKHSRRHRSKEGGMDSPAREAKEGSSSRHSRRSRNSNNLGSESPSREPPGIPKQRRKKGSSEGGSTRSRRSSRSKGQNSMTDISLDDSEHGSKSGEGPMHPMSEEGKNSEGLSGGNVN